VSRSICVTANGSATKTAEVGEFIATVSFLVGSNPADYPSKSKAVVKLASEHPAYQQAARHRAALMENVGADIQQ